MFKRRLVMAFVIVAALSFRPASADPVIFSSVGPGGSFDTSSALFFGFDFGEEDTPDFRFSRAVAFIASTTATLETIDMALQFPYLVGNGTLEVNLFAAGPEGLPGETLERFTSITPIPTPTLTSFESVARPLLVAGETYFLEARTLGQADGLWFAASEVEVGPFPAFDAVRNNDGPWRAAPRDLGPAFRISGGSNTAPVPEPATLLLVGSGLAFGVWRGRQRGRPVA